MCIRFFSFSKRQRSVAYWIRYFSAIEPFKILTTVDFRDANNGPGRVAQRDSFHDEMCNLRTRERPLISPPSPMKRLKLKISKEGAKRSGRRQRSAIGGRNLVRHMYHQCHTCFHIKPVLVRQRIADLPSSSVTPTRSFAICGIDYHGPVYKSPVRSRASRHNAIFVYFATRTLQIELVSDLLTQVFQVTLHRFADYLWKNE